MLRSSSPSTEEGKPVRTEYRMILEERTFTNYCLRRLVTTTCHNFVIVRLYLCSQISLYFALHHWALNLFTHWVWLNKGLWVAQTLKTQQSVTKWQSEKQFKGYTFFDKKTSLYLCLEMQMLKCFCISWKVNNKESQHRTQRVRIIRTSLWFQSAEQKIQWTKERKKYIYIEQETQTKDVHWKTASCFLFHFSSF